MEQRYRPSKAIFGPVFTQALLNLELQHNLRLKRGFQPNYPPKTCPIRNFPPRKDMLTSKFTRLAFKEKDILLEGTGYMPFSPSFHLTTVYSLEAMVLHYPSGKHLGGGSGASLVGVCMHWTKTFHCH